MSDSPKLNLVCPKQYDWAFNKIKLNQAYSHCVLVEGNVKATDFKNKDAAKGVEEAIKTAYIARKGLLVSEQQENLKAKRPRSTSNIDR